MGEFATKFRPEVDLDEFERRLRAASPAVQPQAEGSDPLAELARLVGGDTMAKREDPFEALFRAQTAVAQLHPASQTEAPEVPAASSEAAHYALREPYFEQQPQPQAQVSQEAQGAYAYQNESFASEPLPYQEAEPVWAPGPQSAPEGAQDWPAAFGEPAPEPSLPAFRRKVMIGMATVLSLGVAAIGGTLAMRGKSANQDVVTIQADADPAKVKPPQAEDAAAPSGQALFDRKGGDVSKVVANSEQPADLGVTVKNARVVGAAAGVATPTPPVPSGAAPAAPPPPNEAQAAQSDAIFPSPKKVKTVSVRADGSVIDGGAKPPIARSIPTMAAAAPPPSVTPAVASLPPAAPAAAAPAPAKTPAARSPARAATTTEAALNAPSHPRPAAKDAPAGDAAAGGTGGFAVQLSGTPVESEARSAANSLSVKYAGALQGHKATFVQAKVGDKTIYRVRVGHLTEESAKSMCTAIKAQGGSCFVAKN